MRGTGYRKLKMHLPRQPLSRQRPWLIAGFVLVLIILLVAVYGYFTDKQVSGSGNRQKKINDAILIEIYNEETEIHHCHSILT